MKRFQFLFYFFSFIICNLNAQVGIGTTSPNASSALEIASTNSGILVPRMTVVQRLAIASPAEGLLVYQTNDVEGFYYYEGTKWLNLLSPNSQIGVVPIGSIIAWHGSLAGVGALPDGWVRCQGGAVADVDSPINGRTIPNINGNTTSSSGDLSRGRFLRGSTISGYWQVDQANNLSSVRGSATTSNSSFIALNNNGAISWIETDDYNGNGFGSDRYGFQLRGVENRPTNMTVIWIMRIK